MKNSAIAVGVLLSLGLWVACQQESPQMPYYFPITEENGSEIDTLGYEQLPDFRFANQNGDTVGLEDFQGKIVVADFIFTSCPGICPGLTMNMKRVQKAIANMEDVQILSFSVDPDYDTPEVLRAYVERYDIDEGSWMLLTGDKAEMYDLIQQGFRLTAMEDSTAPGGIFHDQRFALLDGEAYFRGYYFGTEEDEIDRLINDIKRLVAEKKAKENNQ